MNRYKIHEPQERKVWPKYYPGLRLQHKLKRETFLTLEYDMIGPIDGGTYWSCKPSWPSNERSYSIETLDRDYEPI